MSDERRNVGVAEKALTSAQIHTNYVTWGLYSLVHLVLTQLIKCETLHRGELALLFTSIVCLLQWLMDVSSLGLPKDVNILTFSVTVLTYSYDNFS